MKPGRLSLLFLLSGTACPSGDGWNNFAEVVFDRRCAPCHAGYGSYEIVRDDSGKIAGKIQAAAMPPDGGLPPEVRRRVLAWIDRGAPE